MPSRIRLSHGGAATTAPFTTNTFDADASVRNPLRSRIVSMAPASADSCRASTLPRSEVDLMWHFSQRKSRDVMQATPLSTSSLDGGESAKHAMKTVGRKPCGITWSRLGGAPRVTCT